MKKTPFVAALLVGIFLSARARAADPDIDLDVQAAGFDVEALRSALAVDVARTVTLAPSSARAHLVVKRVDGVVVVALREGAREVTRRITLSNDPSVAQETLELVLAAMTRSESRTLAKGPEAPAPAPAPPPPPTAAPAATPTTAPSASPPLPSPSAAHDAPSTAARKTTLQPPERERVVPVGLDLVPFLGVSSVTLGRETRYVSIGAAGSLTRNLYGMSADGAVGIVTRHVEGVQIAGAVAYAGSVHGAQIAGAVNVTSTYLRGVQIAGAVNVADGDVDGAQLGTVNVATGHVRGLQLGVINVADESDAPIGVFNIIKHGRHHLDVWGSEIGLVMGGVELGGKYTHGIVGVGARPGPEGTRPVIGAGFGVHFALSENVGMDLDLLHYDLAAFSWEHAPQLSQMRLVVDLRVAPEVHFFAGPTFNVFVSDDPKDTNPGPLGSWTTGSPTEHVALWPGVTLGGRLFD